ncbi:MAG: aspartate kinase [Rikenellaceae bacterium]|nr:aspartate kinase [Rikenellaceae bacterium]
MKVLKFGGTSVGSASNMRRVAEIVKQESAKITVLSAMSGTTDALVRIVKLAAEGQTAQIEEQLTALTEKYSTCIGELLTPERAAEATALMNEKFDTIRGEAAAFRPYTSERRIIAQGELLTSAIFASYMAQTGAKVQLLHAPSFMCCDGDGKVDTRKLGELLGELTADPGTQFVTQGFICTNCRGEIDNLGRGGSDYSAALMGAAIGADEVQIWTDIDGMHNNDPRFVENTYPIRKMSFDEAAELAYFGAKILHPATIQPCKDRGIAVLLKNTMDPQAPGTRISNSEDDSKAFHAVAAKDGITVIRIYSTRMLMAYGFLRKVFEIFEQHKTPIDMITTSEVAVSLTIDNDAHLDAIVAELNELGKIEIETDNTIVCVVGHMEHTESGLGARVLESLKATPIKMISYGASHRSLAMLIATPYKKQALQSLNDHLFRSC